MSMLNPVLADEDLVTPEHRLHRLELRGLAHDVVDQLIEDMARPAWRAGLGASVLSVVMMARMGVRSPLLAITTSVMIGAAVEHLYGMAEDIHAKVTGDAAGEV